MAEKDITSKILESQNDVFADIFNTLVFNKDDGLKINPDGLNDEPTEAFYQDADGKFRNMFADISKTYSSSQHLSLVKMGIENESIVERPMPVRVMGYVYTQYKKQLDTYTSEKNFLLKLKRNAKNDYEKTFANEKLCELGEFKLIPVITLVLNFDTHDWNQPVNLTDLAEDNPYRQLMQDFGIKVFNIRTLDLETRNKFTSDFKYIVDVLCDGRVSDDNRSGDLLHPLETLDTLIAYTNDNRYRNIRKQIVLKEMEGVKISMGTFLDEIERNKIIDTARKYYSKGRSSEVIIELIMEGLDVSENDAREILDTEVKALVLA